MKKLALVKNDEKNLKQIWYKPSCIEHPDKVISLMEKGKDYFRRHFIDETMELSLKEFLEIIDVFTQLDNVNTKKRKRKKRNNESEKG